VGIPTVFITALPTIATMVGANRTVRGVAVTNPVGEPSLSPEDEFALRRRMVVQALRMLATDVGSKTVWEGAP
jgi:glycine reductase complex component B subunit gamma